MVRLHAKDLEAKNNGTLPPFAFFHIPLPEYTSMIDDGVEISGNREEGECPRAVNSGIFSTLGERGEGSWSVATGGAK